MTATHVDPNGPRIPVPLIGFAAFSGTGKTTLLTQLLPLLKARGLRIAVVKHAHHAFDVDQPGKDSYQLRKAGADVMLVASRKRCALIQECREEHDEPRLSEALAMLNLETLDLVLVEGFKREPIPKIELHRSDLGKPLLFPRDANVIAVACDRDVLEPMPDGLPCLSINDPRQVAEFLIDYIGWQAPPLSGTAG